MRIDDPIWLGRMAKRMAVLLLKREHRGLGDTIGAAAGRLQTRLRVSASLLLECRNRPPREMLVSRWMAVFRAYNEEFGDHAAELFQEEQDRAAQPGANYALFARLADLAAGAGAEGGDRDASR